MYAILISQSYPIEVPHFSSDWLSRSSDDGSGGSPGTGSISFKFPQSILTIDPQLVGLWDENAGHELVQIKINDTESVVSVQLLIRVTISEQVEALAGWDRRGLG